MNFIMRIIVTSIVAFGLSYLLSDGVYIDKFTTAILLAVVLALLNSIVKPILIFLTLPITLVTFGLFLLVINAVIILIADKILRKSFEVADFWWALLFSLLLSIVTSLLYKERRNEKDA
jgi:Predicted membrane protein